jgi:hypothetical protein
MLMSDSIRQVFTRFVASSFAPLANAARQSLALPETPYRKLRFKLTARSSNSKYSARETSTAPN